MSDALASTTLRFIVTEYEGLVGGKLGGSGKMLRARLGFRVGAATAASPSALTRAAAAVEMIHAASLLHDDVIDGGYLRRNAPTFWVERGVPGAILLGDLLLFKALDITASIEAGARLTQRLIRLTGEVCEAETEQELVLRGVPCDWTTCVSIARRKTGALFAFIAFAAGGSDAGLSEALLEAGYDVGTAYQLADDILDANGDPKVAGKSLGSDEVRAKVTAASVAARCSVDPLAEIEKLCKGSIRHLSAWPEVATAWQSYLDLDLRPAVDKLLACFSR